MLTLCIYDDRKLLPRQPSPYRNIWHCNHSIQSSITALLLNTQPSLLHDLLNRLVTGISCVASNGRESHLSWQVHLCWRRKGMSGNKWLPPWSQLATNLPPHHLLKSCGSDRSLKSIHFKWNSHCSPRLIRLAGSNTGKLDVPVKSEQENKRERKETQVWKLSLSAAKSTKCVEVPVGLISATAQEN